MKRRLGIDYDQLFHAIPDNYLVIHNDSPTFTIVDASDAYCELTMVKREDIINRGMFEAFPETPEHVNRNGASSLRSSFVACIESAQPHYMGVLRYDIPAPKGNFVARYWETTNYPIRDETGTVVGILHATEDVTSRVNDNEQIELVKLQQDKDLSYGVIGSWQAEEGSTDIVVDATARKLFGFYDRRDVTHFDSEELLSHIHPDDRDNLKRWFFDIETVDAIYETEFRLAGEDEKWVNVRVRLTTKNNKKLYSGVIIDITERKKSEQELVESERQLMFLADTMPQLVWTATPKGERDYFNHQWVEFTGVPMEELYGDGWLAVVHDEDRELVRKTWQASIESGDDYNAEYRIRRHDGEYEWFMGRGLAYKNKRGVIRKWYGTVTNIHDKKVETDKLEELVARRTSELQETNTNLERSNQELQNFAYVASHDLQEPLRKIQAFGNLLDDEYREQLGGGRDYLDRMKTAAARMSVLIEDLLAFSRITTQARAPVRVDMNMIAKEVINDLETRIKDTQGSVDIGPLPSVMADPTHMRQLLQNLIGNALKFHRSNVAPHVAITARERDDSYEIKVEDNGIGFDKKYADRIFSVFQRLHGRGEYEGTGIGLAVCRKIVERYGGTITASSTIGKGTTFRLILPKEGQDNE